MLEVSVPQVRASAPVGRRLRSFAETPGAGDAPSRPGGAGRGGARFGGYPALGWTSGREGLGHEALGSL